MVELTVEAQHPGGQLMDPHPSCPHPGVHALQWLTSGQALWEGIHLFSKVRNPNLQRFSSPALTQCDIAVAEVQLNIQSSQRAGKQGRSGPSSCQPSIFSSQENSVLTHVLLCSSDEPRIVIHGREGFLCWQDRVRWRWRTHWPGSGCICGSMVSYKGL